jgi:hypothetical protein
MRTHSLWLGAALSMTTACFVGRADLPDVAAMDDRSAPSTDASSRDEGAAMDVRAAEDASAVDAATDTGVARDTGVLRDTGVAPADAGPCSGRLFCDDFEGAMVGGAPRAPWRVQANMGSVTVVNTRARSGANAVRVSTMSAGYKSAMLYVDGSGVFPVAGNVVYGRMMFYMDRAANDGVHWTMIEGRGPLAGRAGVSALYRYGGQHMQRLMSNYETFNARTDCWDHSATSVPQGRWACMEWKFDGPRNAMQFWLDGRELTDIATNTRGEGCIGHDLMDQWLAPTFQRMAVGWESYQMDDAREAFIDDVVFDDERIGCP